MVLASHSSSQVSKPRSEGPNVSSPQGSGDLPGTIPHQPRQDVSCAFINEKNKPLLVQEPTTLGFGNASRGPTEPPQAVPGVSLDNSSASGHDDSDQEDEDEDELETPRARTPGPELRHIAEEENRLPMSIIGVTTAAPRPEAPSYYGDLIGVPPDTFDGTQSESKEFLLRFDLYRMVNEGNDVMRDPYKRVALALSYMKGPKILYWVSDRSSDIRRKMMNAIQSIGHKDEDVWEDFVKDFKTTFTDPFRQQIAAEKFMALTMEGDDLEGYIATFGGLVSDAEWGRDDPVMMGQFYKGLGRRLGGAILSRHESVRANIDQLMNAAREERSLSTLLDLMGRSRNPRHQDDSHSGQTGNRQNDDIASSDGDMFPLKRLTAKDREKMKAEGRCFRCREKGHVAYDCPKGQVEGGSNPA